MQLSRNKNLIVIDFVTINYNLKKKIFLAFLLKDIAYLYHIINNNNERVF